MTCAQRFVAIVTTNIEYHCMLLSIQVATLLADTDHHLRISDASGDIIQL